MRGPGWGLCSAPSLHASLCLVVNMRDEHNNMCNIVSVVHGLGFNTLYQSPIQPAGRRGARPGLWRLPPRPPVTTPELAAVRPIRNRRAPPPARFCSILFPACSGVIRTDSNRSERVNHEPQAARNRRYTRRDPTPERMRNVRCSRYTLPNYIGMGRWRCGLILLMTGYDPGTMGRTRSRTRVPKDSASAALLSG